MSTDLLTRPPVPIDPRLRARRNEVTRDRGRRRLRRFLALLAVVALFAGVGLVARSPLFDVDAVTVHGGIRTGDATLRSVAGIDRGRSMISVDPAAARRRLLHLPWVASASVVRHWPGTVAVDVVERRPAAVVGIGAAAVYVDATGRSLAVASPHAHLPVVLAQPPMPGRRLSSAGRDLVATIAALPAELRDQVRSARASATGQNLVLDDGIVVGWGDASRPEAKASALDAILAQAHRATIATIDVSVPTAVALTRKPGGEP